MKKILYLLLILFVLFTVVQFVSIYIFNLGTLKYHHTYHSKSIEISKDKNLFISTFKFNKELSKCNFTDSLVPKTLFLEIEKIIYPRYYFYFGKTEITSRSTLNAIGFLSLLKTNKFIINCPSSSLPEDEVIVNNYTQNLYYYYNKIPTELVFLIRYDSIADNKLKDSLVYTPSQ